MPVGATGWCRAVRSARLEYARVAAACIARWWCAIQRAIQRRTAVWIFREAEERWWRWPDIHRRRRVLVSMLRAALVRVRAAKR